MRLQDKIALVTGAAQGMGAAIAKRLAAEGATVVAVDLREESVADTLAALGGAPHMAAGCNIADSNQVAALFAKVEAQYGRLDVLVNNAGIGQAPGDGFDKYQERMAQRNAELAAGKAPTTFADHTIDMGDDGWLTVVNVNLNGTFYCCREALRMMSRLGTKGAIVSISSTSAYSGEGGAHYCATKAAVVGLTHALAEEVGPRGIRVNAVVPGPTLTPALMSISEEWRASMAQAVPLNRLADPDEVAKAVAFLASDDASFITGEALVANGGMQMI